MAPTNGAPCDASGTAGGGCVCFDTGSGAPTWTCVDGLSGTGGLGNFGGFGQGGGN